MKLIDKVKIVEVGPRDGLQNEEKFLPTSQKIKLIKQLVQCGIKEIEVTSFVHPRWIPNLADAEEVIQEVKNLPATLFALIPNEKGYDRALKSGINGVTFVLSATDSHNRKNLNRTTKESLSELTNLVQQTRKEGMKYRASVSTVFGCPFEGNPGLDHILTLIESMAKIGFKRIGLCDTIGVANPHQVNLWMTKIKKEFSDIEFELHFHNTYGLGLANVVAAIEAGVYSFDSSIGGLGGCPYAPGATGNISTEDLIHLLHEMGIETGIKMEKVLETADLLHQCFQKDLDSQIWKVKKAKCSDNL